MTADDDALSPCLRTQLSWSAFGTYIVTIRSALLHKGSSVVQTCPKRVGCLPAFPCCPGSGCTSTLSSRSRS